MDTNAVRGRRRLLLLALAIYLIVAAALLFTGGPPAEAGKGLNLTPFATIRNALERAHSPGLLLLFINFSLLIPLGVALAWLLQKTRRVAVLLLLVIASGTIEFIQYLLPGARSTDIDDVILNAGGAWLAYLVVAPWRQSRRARHRPKADGGQGSVAMKKQSATP